MTVNVHRLRTRVLLAGLAATLVGCGSTVQQGSSGGALNAPGAASNGLGGTPGGSAAGGSGGSTTTSGGLGTSGATGTSSGSTGGSFSGGGTTGGGGATSGSGGTTGTTGSGSGSGGGSAASVGTAPGVTATKIVLAYLKSDDQEKVAGSFGIKGGAGGNTDQQFTALGAAVNAAGGILGRKVELYGYNVSTAGEVRDPSAEDNITCNALTQDRKVFAVFGAADYAFLPACLAKSGVASLTGSGVIDRTDLDQNLVYGTGAAIGDLLARAFIDRLFAQKYFTGWDTKAGAAGPAPVKVGILYSDAPKYRRYYDVIKKELARRGFPVAASDDIMYPNTADGVASGSQSAVLRFNSDGVTHVLGAALLFLQAAENQMYRPRYGLDSQFPPALAAQNAPAKQFSGALGVGFRPPVDVNVAQDPGDVSPQEGRCKTLMTKAGVDWKADRNSELAILSECAQVWGLTAALTRSGEPTQSGLRRGFESLGRVAGTLTFSETWGPNRHASASTLADLAYIEKCSCFTYSGVRTSF